MPYLWDDRAWSDYQYWVTQDKKTLRKINALLKDIARTAGTEQGIGKDEILRHSGAGLMSARIDAKNRLVYKVDGGVVRVVSCRGHYGEK